MKVFLAGATGVIGRQLLPMLVRNGHEVTAMTLWHDRVAQIGEQGAEPVVCDVFDKGRLREAVVAANEYTGNVASGPGT